MDTSSTPAAGQAFKIDVERGERRGEVSAQWASRAPEERFLTLTALHAQVSQWADESHAENVNLADIKVRASTEAKGIIIEHNGAKIEQQTHYAVQDIARAAGAPSQYIMRLPPALAALNLQYGLASAEVQEKALYVRETGGNRLLRGITGQRYGRILDRDVAAAVMKVAGNGNGDTRWKVPGMIDWGAMKHNPNVDVTSQNTTLYASDRDVFIFLVDDRNPIEIGKLADGNPDMVFRGFYVWNSEVGDKTFGLATMYLRGVCMNRNLWGVEGFSQTTFAHYAGAPARFEAEAMPALLSYADAGTGTLLEGVKAAKSRIVAKDDEERTTFLMRFGFSEAQAAKLIGVGEVEEGRKPESVWDMAQAVTAMARKADYQEDRLKLEAVGGRMLDKVA